MTSPRYGDLGPDEFAVETPVQIVAKSSLWQGFLRAASVLSTSVLMELFSKLLDNGFGQSAPVAAVSAWLGRISILIIVLAAIYLAVRPLTTVRERLRVRRELSSTADLIAPGTPVRSWSPVGAAAVKPRARQDNPNRADCVRLWQGKVVQVLQALRFEQYETAALYDMTSAIVTVRRRLPDAQVPQSVSPKLEIDRLTGFGILVQISGDRVLVQHDRITQVQRKAEGAVPAVAITEQPEWDAALPALVHHYADRATRWATALDTRRLGAGAQRWFQQEARHLDRLICDCVALRARGDGHAVPATVVAELLHIADALDRWYARNGRYTAKKELAKRISTLVTAEAQPVEYLLARIRAGDPDGDPVVSWLHRYRAPLDARRDEQRARNLLAAPTTANAVNEAGVLLERAWRRLPARDAAGSVCLLVDLAIVRLHEGRLDAARNCLAVAQIVTGTDRDPAGLAHIYETLGVLCWIRGEPRRALHDWQRALSRFRELGHVLGIARCLQHLGAAMAAFPGYGGLLLDGEPGRGEVLRQAGGWLAESLQLRVSIGADVRECAVVPAVQALKGVREELESGTHLFGPAPETAADLLLTRLDRWPLPSPEDAIAPPREP